jgi:hypothetical protein
MWSKHARPKVDRPVRHVQRPRVRIERVVFDCDPGFAPHERGHAGDQAA